MLPTVFLRNIVVPHLEVVDGVVELLLVTLLVTTYLLLTTAGTLLGRL